MSVRTGRQAEQACCKYLQGQGLKLVQANYRCRRGEIDLVMRDGAVLVFIEVRFRTSDAWGSALESVNAGKQRRLLATAQHYLQRHNINQPNRIDVIGMRKTGIEDYEFEWIRNAIQAC